VDSKETIRTAFAELYPFAQPRNVTITRGLFEDAEIDSVPAICESALEGVEDVAV
jgi:hypothetical protein